MPTITFSLTDEDIERIADRVAAKLTASTKSILPESKPAPDYRLQVNRVEAARRLGCCPMTVDRLRQRGLLHPNLATRRPMYPIKELERFVAQCSQRDGL
ncbi:MAG TPA: hypothetical protein VIW67_26255 [Terriglobales bacterium]|jgi:hypothetical protein